MYYPSSENKGADQIRSYCEADLRLCFRKCKNLVFSQRSSNDDTDFMTSFLNATIKVIEIQAYKIFIVIVMDFIIEKCVQNTDRMANRVEQ